MSAETTNDGTCLHKNVSVMSDTLEMSDVDVLVSIYFILLILNTTTKFLSIVAARVWSITHFESTPVKKEEDLFPND